MKTLSFTLLTLATVTTGCTTIAVPNTTGLQERLQNPLFAERFSEDINERLVSLQINDESIANNEQLQQQIEDLKRKWQAVSDEASQKRFEGKYAPFNMLDNLEYAKGSTLLYNNVLYFSSDFDVNAIENVQIYLSPEADPRSGEFPTASDLAVATLESPYGAQSYYIPNAITDPKSVVLYDPFLQKIITFGVLR